MLSDRAFVSLIDQSLRQLISEADWLVRTEKPLHRAVANNEPRRVQIETSNCKSHTKFQ